MTDPAPTTAPPTNPAQPQKDPLAVLEQLLAETKNQEAAKAQTAADQVAAQEAAQTAAINQMEVQHQTQDQQQLEQKKAELASIKDTPEYQARLQQESAQAQDQAQRATAQEGYEIKQLGHTKI